MKTGAVIVGVLGLYLLALNPWFMPDQHDDVLYYFGAISLLEDHAFNLNGLPITDWPPGMSAAIAISQAVLGASVVKAKLLILLFVAIGLWLLPRLLRQEGQPYPWACTALAGLFPISFMMGTRILSEWPFLTLTGLFFLLLERLRKQPQWWSGILLGLLLAAAALTRFIGVFLGAAVVFQWVCLAREQGWKKPVWLRPEILAGALGGGLWLAWRMRSAGIIEAGLAPMGNYGQSAYFAERFSNLEPLVFLARIEEVAFSFSRVCSKLGMPEAVGYLLALGVGALWITGFISKVRTHGFRPLDAYVWTCLALLLLDLIKPERYFMPLAPFLCSYLLHGLELVAARFTGAQKERVLRGTFVLWGCWLVMLNSVLLFKGNASGTHGGLSMLASKSGDAFYKGEWADIYAMCRFVGANTPDEPIAVQGDTISKYVTAFGGRDYWELPWDEGRPHRVLLLVEGEQRSANHQEGWEHWTTIGRYQLIRKVDEQ